MNNLQLFSKNWFVFVFLFLLILIPGCNRGKVDPQVSIVTDNDPGKPVQYAIKKLTDALSSKNIAFEKTGSISEAHGKSVIVAGLENGEGTASQLLKAGNRPVPEIPEALTIWKTDWQEKPVWVISALVSSPL